jgi:predicted Zn-dependent protease
VDSQEVNAFALPGGFVTVNMGLLRAAESGEEIAAVIAHEIQHVERRHGTRRILRELGGTMVLWAVFGGTDIQAPAFLLGQAIGMKYDRDQETESDTLGLELLKKADVDPRGMASFFERLAAESPLNPPELLSTHPDPGNRAERARQAAEGHATFEALPAPTDVVCD